MLIHCCLNFKLPLNISTIVLSTNTCNGETVISKFHPLKQNFDSLNDVSTVRLTSIVNTNSKKVSLLANLFSHQIESEGELT